MSNENGTLNKELGIVVTIASEKNNRYLTSDVPVGHRIGVRYGTL